MYSRSILDISDHWYIGLVWCLVLEDLTDQKIPKDVEKPLQEQQKLQRQADRDAWLLV